jgi:hypothetical protein
VSEEEEKIDFAANSRLIRREIRSKSNARFLRGMPHFKVEQELPQRLRALLAQLERAERSGRP